MKLWKLLLLTGFLLSLTAHSQEIVTTTTSSEEVTSKNYETVIERPTFQSTNRIILDQKTIQSTKAPNLTTLLATQANITITNSNVQPGSIYLRGGDASHVLILVDGLPFYDATTVQRTMNLNDVDIKTIRKIEILKGSQSVLYGGQALSGVIKIETFPSEISSKYSATGEVGERQYRKISAAGFQPVGEDQGILVRAQASSKDNRSPILDSTQTYPSQLVTGDLGYLRQGQWNFFVKAQNMTDQANITNADPATYQVVDATDFVARTNIGGLTAGLSNNNLSWQPKILAGYQVSDRRFKEDPGADSKYGGDLWNTRFEVTPVNLENVQVLTGLSYTKEAFVYREMGTEVANAFNEQKGIFLKATYEPAKNVLLEGGARTDFYKKADHTESTQLGLTLWDQLKFEYATGFKAPSLFQLYSSYGNSNLQPEKSRSYSVSYETSINENQGFSVSVFQTEFEGLIATRGTYPGLQYFNVARARTRGVEAQYSVETRFRLRVDVALGYQEPRDLENDRWLLRRPLQNGSIRLTEKFTDTFEAGVEVLGSGERIDNFGRGEYGSLSSYYLTNLFASKTITQQASVYVRASNVGNECYEDSRGYHNEGAFTLVGIELSN